MLNAIEFSLDIVIGTVLMAGMGQLAIEMRMSIRELLVLKEQCFFASHYSYNCNKMALYFITGAFFTTAVIYSVIGLVNMSKWNPFILGKPGALLVLKPGMENPISRTANLTIFLPMIICIIYFYLCMRITMN